MNAAAHMQAEEAGSTIVEGRRRNLVFITILLGMLLAALDQMIVANALPTIVADLGGAGEMAWVVSAYMVAEAVSAVLAGKFGDLYGRKRIFQLSTVIFVAGSAVAGVAQSMSVLIAARAIQGVGGGGLMVTAMALIADVIPLRDRGKYQGALGAVFGVTTVIGPLIGGVLTDYASWRWCFYINVPIAVVTVAMAARTIPVVRAKVRPIVDYLGIALVALGVTGLILALEWGGTRYAWGSTVIIGLFTCSVVLLAAFVLVELRAREPMLPMTLFRSRVFTVCTVLSFLVGFAMIGAMTYLPAYLQFVNGVSATESGLRTLPLVVGLLVMSMVSGTVVGRSGRYRVFPIAGTAVMSAGLYLMSTMGSGTDVWVESLYMLVLGAGIGLAMQVLTIVVQSTVPYAELGTATSGVTFFRTVGGSFGVAIFGTLYTNALQPRLADALAASPDVPPLAALQPAALHALAPAQAAPIISAYAEAIGTVFLWVVPASLVGFVVAWFLPQVVLRDTALAAAGDMGDAFAAPDSPDRVKQLERAVAALYRRVGDRDALGEQILADSGSTLPPAQAWALGSIHWRTRIAGEATLAAIAAAHRVPRGILDPVFADVARAGYVDLDGDRLTLTPLAEGELERLRSAWRRWLDTQLDDWSAGDPRDRATLEQALDNIAAQLLEQEETQRTPVAA